MHCANSAQNPKAYVHVLWKCRTPNSQRSREEKESNCYLLSSLYLLNKDESPHFITFKKSNRGSSQGYDI